MLPSAAAVPDVVSLLTQINTAPGNQSTLQRNQLPINMGSPCDPEDPTKLKQFVADWGALWSPNSKFTVKTPSTIFEITAEYNFMWERVSADVS